MEALRASMQWTGIEPDSERERDAGEAFHGLLDFSAFEEQDAVNLDGPPEGDRENNEGTLQSLRSLVGSVDRFRISVINARARHQTEQIFQDLAVLQGELGNRGSLMSQLEEVVTSDRVPLTVNEGTQGGGEIEGGASSHGDTGSHREEGTRSTESRALSPASLASGVPLPITPPALEISSSMERGADVRSSPDGCEDIPTLSLDANHAATTESSETKATASPSSDQIHTGCDSFSSNSVATDATRALAMTDAAFDWRREDSRSESRPVRAFDLAYIYPSSRIGGDLTDIGDGEGNGEGEDDVSGSVLLTGVEKSEVGTVEVSTEGTGEQEEPPLATEEREGVVWTRSVGQRGLRSRLGFGANGRSVGQAGGEEAGTVDPGEGGFTTDGRGKVIGTSELPSWHEEECWEPDGVEDGGEVTGNG